MSEVTQTETADLYRLNDEVLVVRFKTDQLIVLQHAREIDGALIRLTNRKPQFILINGLDIQSNMATEAQKYFSRYSQTVKLTKGMPILLNNLLIRLTASVFIKFHKPLYPAIFLKKRKIP